MDFALIDKAIFCRLLRSVHFVVQTRSLEQKEDGIELLWLERQCQWIGRLIGVFMCLPLGT
jgi:hypothetical protein